MQCNETKKKPESTRKFLIQQVEEQSTLCDVTVKLGHWEKKFHHCVLVASPFFEHVLNDNFLEKQSGGIEMFVGTPLTMEMAILFLYGKKPKLTKENIEHMLNLAEFLLIPNLKSACISWLKTVTVAEENCAELLQLSSIYDFEIPKCEEYLFGHLPAMLQSEQMVNLSKESVKYLFSNRKLSYLPGDNKIKFLIRWTNFQPDRRMPYIKELFDLVDLQEVSRAALDELKANRKISEELDLNKIISSVDNENPPSHRVLIMKSENNDSTFWCLDLDREKWFRLKSEAFQRERGLYCRDQISGTRNVNSEIYLTQQHYRASEILTVNLDDDICKTFKPVLAETGREFEVDGICIIGDTCIAYVNERVEISKKSIKETDSAEIERKMRFMTLLGIHPMEQLLALKGMEDDSTLRRRFRNTATLYLGEMNNEKIIMSPLLTFKDDKISKLCINRTLSVAVIFESRKIVSLFDLTDYKIETVQLKTEYHDKLVQSSDGFVIYNQKRFACFTRMLGPSLSSKFKLTKISFERNEMHQSNFVFCENMWYHYYRKSYKEPYILESTHHDEVVLQCSMKGAVWKQLPLPREDSRCNSETIPDRLFYICLPKNRLRCNIECPHCEAQRVEAQSRWRAPIEYDQDDYVYDDSSDDDYYEPMYYTDDYYYDYSD